MERKAHWNTVYRTRSERDVSWFEALPDVSLRLMEAAGLRSETCVIDVGGGDSHLVDALLPEASIASRCSTWRVPRSTERGLDWVLRRRSPSGSTPT